MGFNQRTVETMGEKLKAKLIAFPMPRSLWQYMFHQASQHAYDELKWQFGGNPREPHDGAGHPETWAGAFSDLVHTYYGEEDLIIVRRRRLENPRAAVPADFLVAHTSMIDPQVRRLHVVGFNHSSGGCGQTSPIDTFVLSDEPGSEPIDVSDGLAAGYPHLVINTRPTGSVPLGMLSADGRDAQRLLGDFFDLEGIASRAPNYYTEQEIGHLAGLYEVTPVPVTMAA